MGLDRRKFLYDCLITKASSEKQFGKPIRETILSSNRSSIIRLSPPDSMVSPSAQATLEISKSVSYHEMHDEHFDLRGWKRETSFSIRDPLNDLNIKNFARS